MDSPKEGAHCLSFNEFQRGVAIGDGHGFPKKQLAFLETFDG